MTCPSTTAEAVPIAEPSPASAARWPRGPFSSLRYLPGHRPHAARRPRRARLLAGFRALALKTQPGFLPRSRTPAPSVTARLRVPLRFAGLPSALFRPRAGGAAASCLKFDGARTPTVIKNRPGPLRSTGPRAVGVRAHAAFSRFPFCGGLSRDVPRVVSSGKRGLVESAGLTRGLPPACRFA